MVEVSKIRRRMTAVQTQSARDAIARLQEKTAKRRILETLNRTLETYRTYHQNRILDPNDKNVDVVSRLGFINGVQHAIRVVEGL